VDEPVASEGGAASSPPAPNRETADGRDVGDSHVPEGPVPIGSLIFADELPDGVVVAAMEMQVRERDCPETVGRRDHIVEATLIGTAIARTARAGVPEERPALGVMSLDPQRRQAARIRI